MKPLVALHVKVVSVPEAPCTRSSSSQVGVMAFLLHDILLHAQVCLPGDHFMTELHSEPTVVASLLQYVYQQEPCLAFSFQGLTLRSAVTLHTP